MPRCVSSCSRSWLPTRRCRPRVRTPGWVPLLSPRSSLRSTWRGAPAGRRAPAGWHAITPKDTAPASGRQLDPALEGPPGEACGLEYVPETAPVPSPTALPLPRGAAAALRGRTLMRDKEKGHARRLGLRGAAFPWRTIWGAECSGSWPAGTAAFHINADIAYAVATYIEATEDTAFEEEVGLELLVETARLWRSLGYLNAATDQFRIDGVTGPDEYSAIADNNVYTNLMAQRNLRWAAEGVKLYPEKARALGVEADEAASWREAAEKMFIPFDERFGVTPQAESFTEHEVWDFSHTSPDEYPLLLHFTYFDLYRNQRVKQADLILAMHLRGHPSTPEQKPRTFAYYEPLTVL